MDEKKWQAPMTFVLLDKRLVIIIFYDQTWVLVFCQTIHSGDT